MFYLLLVLFNYLLIVAVRPIVVFTIRVRYPHPTAAAAAAAARFIY